MNEKTCRIICLDRSEGFCERCCRGGALTMHHRLKRGQGGLWEPQNIVALCGDGTRGCHGWCEAHPQAGHDIGFCVKPWEDPAVIPIKYRLSQWVLLTPEGGMNDYVRLSSPDSHDSPAASTA